MKKKRNKKQILDVRKRKQGKMKLKKKVVINFLKAKKSIEIRPKMNNTIRDYNTSQF